MIEWCSRSKLNGLQGESNRREQQAVDEYPCLNNFFGFNDFFIKGKQTFII